MDIMPIISYLLLSLGLLSAAVLFFWKVIFLRNPARNTPLGDDIIVSPADGKVIEVLEFDGKEVQLYKGDKRFLGLINTLTSDVSQSGYIVSIFMSPLDVHHNRAPISGKIRSVKHSDGKFLAVNTLEAGLVNEKSEIIIEGAGVTIKMIQIAGFLARRVITHVSANDQVNTGQVIGLINLGSQVTLVLPESVDIKITKGDRVIAGETILAKINS